MEEKFLHYVWRYKLFNVLNLITVKGTHVELVKNGELNTHSGPDFFNALIYLGETLWAGNVEIHVKSSDWEQHGHQFDKAYDNVILHVVYEHDKEVRTSSGKELETLELKGLINVESLMRYERMKESKEVLACGNTFSEIPLALTEGWLTRLSVERLEQKMEEIHHILCETNNNLTETFYRYFARNFGFRINALPFYILAKSLPYKILQRHSNSIFQLEALLLGQAGFLADRFEEKYPLALQNEYAFLSGKYGLLPMNKSMWKTGGVRPMNFPVLRIAQFAAIVSVFSKLFEFTLKAGAVPEITRCLQAEVSGYWKNHFSFNKPSVTKNACIGKEAAHALIINSIVPFAFLHEKKYELTEGEIFAFSILEQVKAEKNSVTQLFEDAGFFAENALHSQGLLQLKRGYCEKKKCLDCSVAHFALGRKSKYVLA